MNSYIIGISGSWFVLIFSVIIAIGLSFFYYKKTIPQLNRFWKSILFSLRTIGLSLLLLILFEPVLSLIRGSIEHPKLAVVIDNSISMSISDSKGDRKQDYKKILDLIRPELESADNPKFIFDAGFKRYEKYSQDSLKLNGQLTDISKPIEWINQIAKDENIQSILLITDGNYNSGKNPLYETDNFAKPVYVIGIGDTNASKDLSITSIITNEIMYVNNASPVSVNITINGYALGKSEIKLFDNSEEIARQDLTIDPQRTLYSLSFEYKPIKEGMHKLTVRASQLENELTLKNNIASEFINVMKNKRKYLVFAGSPSSDLSFFKNSVLHESGVEVKSYVNKNVNEYYEGIPNKLEIQSADIIVLIGFPVQTTQISTLEMIKSALESGKPLFFMASQNVDYSKLKYLDDYLPFTTLSARQQEFSAISEFTKQGSASPIMRLSGKDNDLEQWNQLPPIFRTETFIKAKPESEVLALVKVNNVTLNEPMILSRQFLNKKSIAISGYGIYRWKLLGYAPEIAKGETNKLDLYDKFIQNSMKWLAVEPNKKNVIIRTSKKAYLLGERIEFNAQVYDASMTPIDDAILNLIITNGKEKHELTLMPSGNGRYSGYFESLKQDDYYFSGEAYINQFKLGADNGRFSVGELSIEYSSLRMSIELLKEIARRSGGKFYDINSAGNCLKDIKSGKYFQPTAVTLNSEIPLWNYPWILGIAIVIFALEWFIRKRFGLL